MKEKILFFVQIMAFFSIVVAYQSCSTTPKDVAQKAQAPLLSISTDSSVPSLGLNDNQ